MTWMLWSAHPVAQAPHQPAVSHAATAAPGAQDTHPSAPHGASHEAAPAHGEAAGETASVAGHGGKAAVESTQHGHGEAAESSQSLNWLERRKREDAEKAVKDKEEAQRRQRQRELEPKRPSVCGELPRSITWNRKRMRLDRTVTVPKGMTLWIDPDVEVVLGPRDSCQPGNAPVGLVVEGRLVVKGNAWSPVRFRAASPQGTWAGIRVSGQADFESVRISQAEVGIRFHGAQGSMQGSVLESCVTGVLVSGGSAPRLSHNVFTRNSGVGLRIENASPKVTGCLFLDNRGVGVWFDGSGLTSLARNAFWQNLLGDVVGSKAWGQFAGKGAVRSDRDGNLRCDPILAGSLRDNAWQDSLRRAGAKVPEAPFGMPPYALSWLSPLREKGPILPKRPWRRTDIGLYGRDND